MEQWQCIMQDAYPAYISWAQFWPIRSAYARTPSATTTRRSTGRGAPREGAALLQGLLTCGRCGYRMTVAYRPRSRYTCAAMTRRFAEARCVHLEGPPIEAFVVQAFFDAIAPAQLEALDEVLAQRQRDQQRLERYHHQQVTQARFSANLARRRYEQVDPQYRLAAAELERDWDDKLRALRQAEEAAARFAQAPAESTLSPELRAQLVDLSDSLPAWWASDQIRHDQRKALLRSLISQVIVTRPATDRVAVKIIWVSGHYSEGTVIPPVLHQRHVTGYDTMVERIGQLWAQGSTDAQIAETLSAEGFRSARRDRVLPKTVLKIRRHHHWVSRYHQHRLADKIDGLWTIHGLARHLGVPREWFYNRIRSGFLREPDVMRKPPYGNYLIRDDAGLLAQTAGRSHSRVAACGETWPRASLPPLGESSWMTLRQGNRAQGTACHDIENKSSLNRLPSQTPKEASMDHSQEHRRHQAMARYLAGDKIEVICRDLHCAKSWLYKWKARYQADNPAWATRSEHAAAAQAEPNPSAVVERILILSRTLGHQGNRGGPQRSTRNSHSKGSSRFPHGVRFIVSSSAMHRRTANVLSGLACGHDLVVLLKRPRDHGAQPRPSCTTSTLEGHCHEQGKTWLGVRPWAIRPAARAGRCSTCGSPGSSRSSRSPKAMAAM